tara:strand:- start:3713 stop:4060 length:348 start_codon:yes stop_codon:yes gene_type:complete
MKPTYIIFIVQSSFILVLFFILVFKKAPTPMLFDYDRIKNDMEVSIATLQKEFDLISIENSILYEKLDSLKNQIPDNRRSLDKINREIKKLNETYIISNYRDSSDVALIRRLSGK